MKTNLENRLSKMQPENRFWLAIAIGTLLGLIIPLTVFLILFSSVQQP